MNNLQLSQENLAQIAKRIPCPTYNRQALKAGIVHIGVGGFHRSHQAYYIHQLLGKHSVKDWGICGVGLREADRNMYEVLKKQDYLYTLTIQHPNGDLQNEVIGSLTDYLLAVDTPEKVIKRMAATSTRIVSLTITEGGYNFNPQTEAFDFDNPDVQHELKHPDQPRTVFGFLSAALKDRRTAGVAPFSILSCDNIQHNGDMARKMVLAFTREQDSDLADWVEANVSFPNTMVDRITPGTSPEDISSLLTSHGIIDEWPVICEPFIQWVVEDQFSNGRPPLEQVGVQFVENVTPYETMKIRLLNAGHSVLGIPGAIHGHPTINACMGDPVFAKFMRQFMDKEATPVLSPMPGTDLEAYKDKLEERFSNPNIKDSVGRICSESSAKLPKFLVPTIQENLATGGSIEYATLVLAAWCYYHDKGTNESNDPLEIIDANKSELHGAAKNTQADPLSFLRQKDLFGGLADNERFAKEYHKMIVAIYQEGNIRKTMNQMLQPQRL
jgi:mannitol 2-dehydrogenase